MVIPAAMMDQAVNKRVNDLWLRVSLLEEWVRYFIERDKILTAQISDLQNKTFIAK